MNQCFCINICLLFCIYYMFLYTIYHIAIHNRMHAITAMLVLQDHKGNGPCYKNNSWTTILGKLIAS
jgi:hypothetical protein